MFITKLEENKMPNKDGTGPRGEGPCTGRGLGPCGCKKGKVLGRGFGMGFGRQSTTQNKNSDKNQEN
jgi:hypothetical protein